MGLDLEVKYKDWFNSKKPWFCANSSRLDEILHYLQLEGIINPMDKQQIESANSLTIQFAIVYNAILKAGPGKVDTVIDVMRKSIQDDVVEEFVKFKNENMQPAGTVTQMLRSISFPDINENYKAWFNSKMDYLCGNSSKLDEVLMHLMSQSLITVSQKRQIESAKGLTKKFFLVFDIMRQLGVEQLDTVIEIFGKTEQEHILEQFLSFKVDNSVAISNEVKRNIPILDSSRTTLDKPLVNIMKPQKVPMEIDDTIDFVHNMEPLDVLVKEGIEYFDKDHKTAYKMRSTPRGFALIINNRRFQDPNRNRTGAAEKDKDYTMSLLKQLDYKVTVKEDVRSTEIKEILHDFKEKFKVDDVDSCIVVVMSHGGNNTIEMADGEYIHIWQDIIYRFDNYSCPQLIRKPKIFIVQACQNFEVREPRTSTDSILIPTVSDMLVCFSTIPGFVSHRDKYLGSWYIYCLSKVFMENAHQLEITKMLQQIANTMMNVKSENDSLQVSTYQPILFRDFYFNPGL